MTDANHCRQHSAIVVDGPDRAPSRAMLRAVGFTDADFAKPVVGVVVPAGYSFNLDGTCIYLTCAALFLAQATDTPMSVMDQIGLLAVMLLTSKGAAGITGSGFIVLAATISTTGNIPPAALAVIFGIDRFMSEIRGLTNLIGNAVATLVISKWEGAIDESKATEILVEKRG